MSKAPTGTKVFSVRSMIFAKRCASGTPRRRMPRKANPSTPSFFSTISYARRTMVRSTSDADINCAFWRKGAVSGIASGLISFLSGFVVGFRLYWSGGSKVKERSRLLKTQGSSHALSVLARLGYRFLFVYGQQLVIAHHGTATNDHSFHVAALQCVSQSRVDVIHRHGVRTLQAD